MHIPFTREKFSTMAVFAYCVAIATAFVLWNMSPNSAVASFLREWREWVVFAYLSIQMWEIITRDPIEKARSILDHIFSALPMIAGLSVMKGSGLPDAHSPLMFLTVAAAFDFVVGVSMSMAVLTTPYQRGERRSD